MKAFLLSLQSEFFKTRKTLAFWGAVLLPLLICGLVFIAFYVKAGAFIKMPALMLWISYLSASLGVMGTLLLPMYCIFMTYSINGIEHRSDTWKSMFSLPIPKLTIYASKYIYTVILVLFTLLLFASFTLLSGNLLGMLKPELKFGGESIVALTFSIYLKLFLSCLGILSIQFFLSLAWSDFLKPMGIGFIGFIAGVMAAGKGWEYAWTIPYAHPFLAVRSISTRSMAKIDHLELLTKEVWVSLSVAAVMFVVGYFIISKKSVK